jgi:hypothetical protein
MATVLDLIWGKWEQKYFSENQKKDSTALSTSCPTGKSLDSSESKFRSCPGRGAAYFTLLRRAGTQSRPSRTMDPGSAAHHAASHSASKTRVNALMALRSIRGTSG